jgi:hypothetical protein
MKVAYVAGPYKASTTYKTLKNIREAEYVALKLWKMGYAVICPHKNTSLFDGECEETVWLDGYLEIIKRCDVVVPLPSWLESGGSIIEVAYAKKHNILVRDINELTTEE